MRIAVFSDIHANLPALQAVLKDIRKRRIRRIYCAGDLIGDGPYPREVLELLRRHKVKCIRGHADLKILRALERRKRDRLSNWTIQQLTVRDIDLLKSLAARSEIEASGKKILLVHGSPFSEMECITRNQGEEDLEEILSDEQCHVLICGHSHQPFIRNLKNGWVINCGAVGKHINGASVAQYALLTIRDGKIKADIREVAYPHEQLLRAAMERNFPLEEGSVISIQAGKLDSAERLRESVISAELSLLRSLIKVFQAAEAELDAENVRHLRIAARRLLHALRTFSAYFPRRLLHLRRLKELRLIAGQLRELDVLMEFLGSYQSQLKENQAGGLPLLRDEIAARREESQLKLKQQLVEFHRNHIFQSLQSAITYEARSKPRKENGVDPSLGMRTNFHRLIKRMVREVVNFLDRARNPLRREEFHQLRIACKKLRYTLEFFDSVSSHDNQAEVDTLQQFQRLMGKIHDLDSSTVLLEALRESLKRRLDAADALVTVDYYCVAFQRDRMELFGNFLETLPDFENSRFFDSLVPDGGR